MLMGSMASIMALCLIITKLRRSVVVIAETIFELITTELLIAWIYPHEPYAQLYLLLLYIMMNYKLKVRPRISALFMFSSYMSPSTLVLDIVVLSGFTLLYLMHRSRDMLRLNATLYLLSLIVSIPLFWMPTELISFFLSGVIILGLVTYKVAVERGKYLSIQWEFAVWIIGLAYFLVYAMLRGCTVLFILPIIIATVGLIYLYLGIAKVFPEKPLLKILAIESNSLSIIHALALVIMMLSNIESLFDSIALYVLLIVFLLHPSITKMSSNIPRYGSLAQYYVILVYFLMPILCPMKPIVQCAVNALMVISALIINHLEKIPMRTQFKCTLVLLASVASFYYIVASGDVLSVYLRQGIIIASTLVFRYAIRHHREGIFSYIYALLVSVMQLIPCLVMPHEFIINTTLMVSLGIMSAVLTGDSLFGHIILMLLTSSEVYMLTSEMEELILVTIISLSMVLSGKFKADRSTPLHFYSVAPILGLILVYINMYEIYIVPYLILIYSFLSIIHWGMKHSIHIALSAYIASGIILLYF